MAKNQPTRQQDPKPWMCQGAGCRNRVRHGVEFCEECQPEWRLTVEEMLSVDKYRANVLLLRNRKSASGVTGKYSVSGTKDDWQPVTTATNGFAQVELDYQKSEAKLCVMFPGAEPVYKTVPVKPGGKASKAKEFAPAVNIFADSRPGTGGAYVLVRTTDADGNAVPGEFALVMDFKSTQDYYKTSDGGDGNPVGALTLRLNGYDQPRQAKICLIGGKGEHATTEVKIYPRESVFQQPEMPADAAIKIKARIISCLNKKVTVLIESYWIVEGREVQQPCWVGVETGHLPFFITHTSDGMPRKGVSELPSVGDAMQQTEKMYLPSGVAIIEIDAPKTESQLVVHPFGRDADTTAIDLPVVTDEDEMTRYQRLPVMHGAGGLANLLGSFMHGMTSK